MKKKFVAIALCSCMALGLFACGKEDSTTGESASSTNTESSKSTQTVYTDDDVIDDSAEGLNVLDYVELSAYKGLKLTKNVTIVTQEDVTTEKKNRKIALTKGEIVVQKGDVTVIDFVGKLDGVAFEGGSGTDFELEIGSGTFIDGFEDGLIGVKKGETVDLNLTFPKDYQSADLAGKAVVFTVTVDGVQRAPGEEGDTWYTTYTDYASASAYETELKATLEKEADEAAEYDMKTAALDTVIEGSKVSKYYKSYLVEGENQYETSMSQYASYFGATVDQLLQAQGISKTDYDNDKAEAGVAYAQGAMVILAIADKEGLSSEDEKYQAILKDFAAGYGVDASTLVTAFGENLVKVSVMSEYVMDYVVENATVDTKMVEKTSEEETSGTASEETTEAK